MNECLNTGKTNCHDCVACLKGDVYLLEAENARLRNDVADAVDLAAQRLATIKRLRGHIEKALLDFCQGSCPTCGDDYPEDLADGCETCIWVHDAQALLDATEARR